LPQKLLRGNHNIAGTPEPIFIKLGMCVMPPQLLEILDIDLGSQNQLQQLIRKIDNHSMADFVMKLSSETGDTVFNNFDIDIKFNSFLITYLRIFYSSLPLKKKATNNTWMTTGIKKKIMKLCQM
jgi:hypothetical protein